MTPAPYSENYDLSRALHRLWPNRHAQIQLTEGQRSVEATGHTQIVNTYRKTHVVIVPMSPVNSARAGRDKAIILIALRLFHQAQPRDFPLVRFSDAKERHELLNRPAWRPRKLHRSGHVATRHAS